MSFPGIVEVQPLLSTRAVEGPFDYRLPERMRGRVGIGALLRVPFGGRQLAGVVVGLRARSELPSARLREPLTELGLTVPAELIELARWVAETYCTTFARALALVLPPGASRYRRARQLREAAAAVGPNQQPRELTAEQLPVLEEVRGALAGGAYQRLLIHGVTGSGKTELYLQAAEAAVGAGRGVILLVPEIALTPQTARRLAQRFGDQVVVLHSGLGEAERAQRWLRLRSGEVKVCLGPRSAIFAPVANLGLVVVDEEHDASYKHEADPRYDARRVAERRAERAGAVLLLGSATPRAESFYRARRLVLARRVDGGSLPPVEVLDMRRTRGQLHPRVLEELDRLARGGGQGVVLLNRRGFSRALYCAICGQVWSCPNCDLALVWHRGERALACHHCGHREPLAERCSCGSRSLVRRGLGTERLEQQLRLLLGERVAVFRLDSDVLAAEGRAAEAVLASFAATRPALLLGTQMVAKGHDFPGLELGVVVEAEGGLYLPDFRAEERTFALITQLAGRVGRGASGRVLVQTTQPQARAIRHAAGHDVDGFLADELERRRALGYPPFVELVRLVVAASEPEVAAEGAALLRGRLEPLLAPPQRLLGPAQLLRLQGRHRQALLVKAPVLEPALEAVRAAVAQASGGLRQLGARIAVDVDPH